MNISDVLNKDAISELLKQFSIDNRQYKSEAQLQFELAWAIKTLLNKTKCENSPEVWLEYFGAYRQPEGGKVKKFFTDIMVIDSLGNYIPIEIKYKTTSVRKGDISVFENYGHHGATDLGRFDYLWDVKRVQYLKHKNAPDFVFNEELKQYSRGFAILLTNDELYWTVTKDSLKQNNKDPLYLDFCIGDGEKIPAHTELKWNKKRVKSAVDGTWRDEGYIVPLKFDTDIDCKWDPYTAANSIFKYLIIEIPN